MYLFQVYSDKLQKLNLRFIAISKIKTIPIFLVILQEHLLSNTKQCHWIIKIQHKIWPEVNFNIKFLCNELKVYDKRINIIFFSFLTYFYFAFF